MLTALLAIAVQAQSADAEPLSPGLHALVEIRGTLAPDEFLRRAEALGRAGDMTAVELLGELYYFGGGGAAKDAARACGY